MSEKKAKKIRVEDLKTGDVVWSSHYEQCLVFLQIDFDDDYIFEFTLRDGYCVPRIDNLYEAPSLLKELM